MLYGLVSFTGVRFEPKTDIPDLSGKVVLITGGNVGLGRETILQLSHHNPAHIYLAARTASKAHAAIADLQTLVPGAPITFIECDLTSFASVQKCAREFVQKEKRLDLLFLNAGVMALPPGQTKEGYEIQFGTNHMGHALLTKLLLPTLKRTAKEVDGADVRVVAVSSIGHTGCNGLAFDKLKTDMASAMTFTRYAQSKLSNILFTNELARRFGRDGITAVSVHPGMVDTELYNSVLTAYGPVGRLINRAKWTLWTSVQDGAKGQLWAGTAALAIDGKGKGVKNGGYYTPVGVEGQGTRLAYTEPLGEELWTWTEKELDGWEL